MILLTLSQQSFHNIDLTFYHLYILGKIPIQLGFWDYVIKNHIVVINFMPSAMEVINKQLIGL